MPHPIPAACRGSPTRSMPGARHPDPGVRMAFGLGRPPRTEADMDLKIVILVGYFLAILAIAAFTRLRLGSSSESYFLADRRLGGVVLLATMAATNFSAFTVYGTSGAGYRDGYGFLPLMAFGTGFMALSFWVIGRKAWRVGRESGVMTPPELVGHLYASPALS